MRPPALSVVLSLILSGCTQPADPSLVRPPGAPPGLDDDDAGDDDAGDDDAGDDDAGDDDDAVAEPEVRGLWVTRWNYSTAADVQEVVANAADAGFNAIFFQVRGTADAYYESSVEPWAARLTGTLGQDPGWDPLQTALDAGADRGVAIHAWLNTFPAWSGGTLPAESTPRHALLDHPDWLVADTSGTPIALNSSYVFFSPGNQEVRAHVAAVVGDLVDRYDVAGVHLDYVRYPGPQYSHDAGSEAAFAAASGGLSWADWERLQVTETVRGVRQAIEESRPGTTLSAAVWGIYTDDWGWNTSEGAIDYYQDSLAMVDEGALDAIVPMIYWPLTDPPGQYTDYRTLVGFFGDAVPGEALWAGLHGDYGDFGEIADEIDVARAAGASGVVVFAYSYVEEHGYWDDFAAGPFAEAP